MTADIVIRAREGALTGPLRSVRSATDAAREIDRLLGRLEDGE